MPLHICMPIFVEGNHSGNANTKGGRKEGRDIGKRARLIWL